MPRYVQTMKIDNFDYRNAIMLSFFPQKRHIKKRKETRLRCKLTTGEVRSGGNVRSADEVRSASQKHIIRLYRKTKRKTREAYIRSGGKVRSADEVRSASRKHIIRLYRKTKRKTREVYIRTDL